MTAKNDTPKSELLPCPFCGSNPIFPESKDVFGTCYEAGCEDCCIPHISIQIIDCFDYGESPNRSDVHDSWDQKNIKYGDKFIEVARSEAIDDWNSRV